VLLGAIDEDSFIDTISMIRRKKISIATVPARPGARGIVTTSGRPGPPAVARRCGSCAIRHAPIPYQSPHPLRAACGVQVVRAWALLGPRAAAGRGWLWPLRGPNPGGYVRGYVALRV
jgi:hypothetical protein